MFVSRSSLPVSLALAALVASLLWPRAHVAAEPPFDAARVPVVADVATLDRADLLLPRGPAAACGAPVVIRAALVDPDARPDRDGEQVVLANLGPSAIDLRSWQLSDGHRTLALPSHPLRAGGSVTLGGDGPVPLRPLRLANHGGTLLLRDPCGLERSQLAWGDGCPRPPPGWWVETRGQKRVGPARSVECGTGGADGGCGQT